MAANLQQRVDSIKGKAQLLMERYAELIEEKRVADAKIDELQSILQKQQREMAALRVQLENLRVVSTITPKREDVEKSRAFLSQLLRDIDKCIAELTD
ncbi:MAG: DUF3450 domain-containing protein [Firmicutes bacterium]|nr:DUF3450 domain-containing protein [Bacillota bacterium]MCM1400535.1 DUF3450 domain-containing protein [Bacteroides sp.]MCM1476439.1 DUF3450 domain-containing protein [Bacteroides sp.]